MPQWPLTQFAGHAQLSCSLPSLPLSYSIQRPRTYARFNAMGRGGSPRVMPVMRAARCTFCGRQCPQNEHFARGWGEGGDRGNTRHSSHALRTLPNQGLEVLLGNGHVQFHGALRCTTQHHSTARWRSPGECPCDRVQRKGDPSTYWDRNKHRQLPGSTHSTWSTGATYGSGGWTG